MVYEETAAQRKRRKVRYAIHLRKRMTVTEKIFWDALRNRQYSDLKFRRQAPISWFVVDFLCMKHNLIVEIDGPIHEDQKTYDQERDEELKRLGYKILRFTNEDILYRLEATLQTIKAIASPLSR